MTLNIEQVQGGTVYDSDGDKVGSVGQIYLDDTTGEPNWVTVNTGLFGTKETFVPLDGARVEDDEIHVPHDKGTIKDAPQVDADGHIDEEQEAELYRYYGVEDRRGFAGDRDGGRAGAAGGAAGAAGAAAGTRDGGADRGADGGADGGAEFAADGHADRGADGGADGGAEFAADGHADRGADGGADGGAGDLDGDSSVVRHEEELRVGTEKVETGRVRLRKHVVTDTETVQVPVEREEVEIVREPIADGETGGDLGDGDVEVTLTEERPVVEKEVVAKERVGLDKETVTENRDVQAEVGREEVEIERDGDRGDVDRSGWSDADYEREGYTRGDDGGWLDRDGKRVDDRR
ncbi:hypothetical protein GCM10022199_04220 [Marihabitans asiaticum]|uniref:Uncharacterized protein (TIGR02271 family) n=1 Tax=Marihabitans asiaticum TaxID=415218 RepID=A0A560WE92_9MICO|nr:PRC and DUF2382 domain-containing protein [Marihabitans asiaticum]TWD15906.1 uncharacterized protein (TIGR02271 family) [Marihabitans asiaticum]